MAEDAQHWFQEFSTARAVPVRTAVLAKDSRNASKFSLRREGGHTRAVWNNFLSAFLPEGYPNSVTPDYLPFQTWDSLQGLATYIRSMLSTQALLGGIGVGETTATVVGATFQWFLRDFTGMLGSILFTLHQGSNLDSSAKQWRLAADLLNDVGMLMDLVSPLFPGAFVTILCIGSMARSVTGVASGATRAALTQHFALRKNAADVSAKEGSQETAATMVGMLLGMVLARWTAGNAVALWGSFLLLTAFHMYANYRAVRSLCLTSLNAERASILLRAFKEGRNVPTPREVADQEHLLPQIPSLPWQKPCVGDASLPKSVLFGVPISSLKLTDGWSSFPLLVERYSTDPYLVVPEGANVHVVLHKMASPQDLLRAYVHALCVADLQARARSNQSEEIAISWMKKNYATFLESLGASGWSTDRILVVSSEWRAEWLKGLKQE